MLSDAATAWPRCGSDSSSKFQPSSCSAAEMAAALATGSLPNEGVVSRISAPTKKLPSRTMVIGSAGCHVGVGPVRPMPYTHQIAPMVIIQPKKLASTTKKPRRAPRFVPTTRYVPPMSTTTEMRTTTMPRSPGLKSIANKVFNIYKPLT